MTFDELPAEWQRTITRLRRENAKYRTQCQELRQANTLLLSIQNTVDSLDNRLNQLENQ